MTGGDLNIRASGTINIDAKKINIWSDDFMGITVSSFYDIVDSVSGKSLQEVLNSKMDKP
ncbi:hypothetical protein D3C77_606270 [compost metagenome]